MLVRSFLFLILLSAPAFAANNSGLPIPRWVALKSTEVNVRTGPGTRYPIQWIYRRDGMPVEVTEEFELWRKIRDADGTGGWVHKSMLTGARNIMVRSKEPRVLRLAPEQAAKAILKAESRVIARIVECEKDWCRIQLSGRKGWIEKKYLWGVYDKEILD